jgi:hypothetical protein
MINMLSEAGQTELKFVATQKRLVALQALR